MQAIKHGVPKSTLGINVFQGSPHKYGPEGASESLKHMSKGEGAQAFGWGRYDAENIDVAKEYQRNLAIDKIRLNNKEVVSKHGYMNPDDVTDAFKLEYNLDDKTAFQMSQAARSPAPDLYFDSKAISFDKEFDLTGDKVFKEGAAEYRKYGKIWTDLNARLEKTTDSNLYKHDLPDEDIARYLDWDAPLSEQVQAVQDIAKQYGIKTTPSGLKEARGSDIYRAINQAEQKPPFDSGTMNPGTREGSEALGRAGIPGLKYYDGMSRKPGASSLTTTTLDARIQSLEADLKTGLGQPEVMKRKLASLKAERAKHDEANRTRNYVTWDQEVLDRMKLLERNSEDMTKALMQK